MRGDQAGHDAQHSDSGLADLGRGYGGCARTGVRHSPYAAIENRDIGGGEIRGSPVGARAQYEHSLERMRPLSCAAALRSCRRLPREKNMRCAR